MTLSRRATPAGRGLAVLLAAVWVPYFVIHCTRCPQQLVGWEHCASMAASTAPMPSHARGTEHGGHVQAGSAHGEHAASDTGKTPASKNGENCCGADELRAAATDSVPGNSGAPTAAAQLALPLSLNSAPTSHPAVRRLRANGHAPPRYLTLRTLIL